MNQTQAQQWLSSMTLEEKAAMCSGRDYWRTNELERLGIPSIVMMNGPHGLRKLDEYEVNFDVSECAPATCFPSASALASSWNMELLEEIGIALGKECHAANVDILLGPGVNLKRSPLCGRNFEYFSEDPYLSGQLAKAYIIGVQSQGVGTSLKHYACNNREARRMTTDAIVEDRALREMYLASFEEAVKGGKPWTVMSAYNRVNGSYCSEHPQLLNGILKEEWGFQGAVVSDWGAVNILSEGIRTGLDLEMPSSDGLGADNIVQAVRAGKLSEEALDKAVERLLNLVIRSMARKGLPVDCDYDRHHQLARTAAAESIVLLKNKQSLLPLSKGQQRIALIGAMIQAPKIQGGGSSHMKPTQVDDVTEAIASKLGEGAELVYAPGYDLESEESNLLWVEEAQAAAASSDTAIVLVGLPEKYESEAYDRDNLRIPSNQEEIIRAMAQVQKNVVVVLCNGSPVEMPWADDINGILEAYLGGQAFGGALADVLFGDVNPSGKLAETFPVDLRHTPAYLSFPGEEDRIEYREGLFIGYRYFDAKNIEPLYPFGFGLSYTSFEYSGLQVDKRELSDVETLTVRLKVRNSGDRVGKETVQLYVRDNESRLIRPEKELKAFAKVELKPDEEKEVVFTLDKRAFAYYDPEQADWIVETGDFDILVGQSSRHILLVETVHVRSTSRIVRKYNRQSSLGDLIADPLLTPIVSQLINGMADSKEKHNSEMMAIFIREMPLRSLVAFSKGTFTDEMLDGLLQQVNAVGAMSQEV
ncbi:glycoside hydrolase family 3 C-terminal domain-containing protein [Cohnella abietis]|uniref:Glycosyl hydrolase n=1 Tax=Cohnella abietis TaxID=2507935 RepID=A0A3T1D9M6_9BACL|nr:glycoside hydrolase family 3 C-terminal domain-containing protein [Cohnella abietis]BBI34797.1 glycosyl hydrolase [Cohnella abietis]